MKPSSFRFASPVLAAGWFVFASICSAQNPQLLIHHGGHDDRSQAVATDASGSILVGGYSNDGTPATFAVLKYNAAGTFQWMARAQGLGEYLSRFANDLTADSAGNIYAVGYAARPLPLLQTEMGWLVASFAPNGTQRWARLFNGPDNSADIARSVALHPSQGLYVSGITAGEFGRADWLTIKYSLDGAEQWRRLEIGSGNTEDQPIAVKTDAAGNAIVAGFMETSQGGPKDIRVVKYDAAGNVLWRADYSHTAVSDEFPNDLAVDAGGNIYVVGDRGISTNPELGSTPITLKYSPSGQLLYVLTGPGRGGAAIEIDGANNFVVSGLAVDEAGSNLVPATAKFSPDGTQLWSQPIYSTNLAVDDLDGSVYLTRGFSFAAVKLNANGQLLWEYTVPAGTQATDSVVDDVTGAFLLTGNASSNSGDILTARFGAGSTPPPPPPPGPAAPSDLGASAKKGAISLTWTDRASDETGFRIERSVGGSAFVQIAQVGANVRSYNNTGLTKGVTYTYRVRAFNAAGYSAYSNLASAVPR